MKFLILAYKNTAFAMVSISTHVFVSNSDYTWADF